MKAFVWIIFLISISAGGVAVYKVPYSRCDTPLTYKIGSVDTRFGLSESQVLKDIDDAGEILGKSLFEYASASGQITVNFVYDKRTELNLQVDTQQSQLTQKNAALQKQIKTYESDVQAFEKKLTQLNDEIVSYNSRGGAPPDVFSSLIDRQKQLKTEGDLLNARAAKLNLASRDYNFAVQNLNQNVAQFNQEIVQKPEEGVFDGNDNSITIYFANNKSELIHTLAHEFGHAIGMTHIENPKAIMYPMTTGSLAMTADDINQLTAICKPIPLPEHWIEELKLGLISIRGGISHLTGVQSP